MVIEASEAGAEGIYNREVYGTRPDIKLGI